MERKCNGNWDAASYFKQLTETNILAKDKGFIFATVDGLEGFNSLLSSMQSGKAFVCVSEVSQGTIELLNTPRTRRIKTVFLAMRHKVDDPRAREEKFDIMRELFRQFMSHLLREKIRLQENYLYVDPRITFREIEKYFFSGCACAYFQISVDNQTSLMYEQGEWSSDR